MATLKDWQKQRALLDAQRAEAIASIRVQMAQLGITVGDLVDGATTAAERPVKYRDEATGKTWTGVGVRPTWLRNALMAGATLEQFAVKP